MVQGSTTCKEKEKNKERFVEGFDTGSDALNNVENELIESVKTMRDDIILFAKWSVINVFVVWVIWRVGAHVIWYNSIPRILLKATYPPGYDYLKQILNENMGDGKCADVMHSGGMVQEKAVYEPDQLDLFNEKKSCCPGLELPIPEGDDMDVPCWPLHTSHSTVKKLNNQNFLYKVWNDDYSDCVSYVTWKGEADQQAAQAEAQSIQSEIQLEKARQKEAQAGGDGMGMFYGRNNELRRLSKAGNLNEETLTAMGAGHMFIDSKSGKRLEPGVVEGQVQAANAAAQDLGGGRWSEMMKMTRAKAMSNLEYDQQSAGIENDKGALNLQHTASDTRMAALIKKGQKAVMGSFGSDKIDITKYMQQQGEAADEEKAAATAPQMPLNPNFLGQNSSMMQKRIENVRQIQQQEGIEAALNSSHFKELPAAQQQVEVERMEQEAGKEEESEEKTRVTTKLNSLKKELKIKEADQSKVFQLSKKELQYQDNLAVKHTKRLSMLQMTLDQKQKKDMEKRLEKLIDKREKYRQKKVKFDEKMAYADKKKDAKLAKQALKDREVEVLKMEKAENLLTEDAGKSTTADVGGVVKQAIEMIWKGLLWLLKSGWNLLIFLLKATMGCSWDQGLRGIITGPNTLTSLSTSFILAIKASVSWLIYSCITASGGNIIISFLFATVFLALGTALVNIVWISPLSTLWTFFEFKWPSPMMFAGVILFLPLSVIYGIIFGILYIFYSWAHVIEFHFNCLFSSKGDKFKSQLKGCSNIQATLRRLFFILTIINAVQTLDPKVVTGIILCFLYIEYKKMK